MNKSERTSRIIGRRLGAWIIAAAVAGCTVGPDFKPPVVDVPLGWDEQPTSMPAVEQDDVGATTLPADVDPSIYTLTTRPADPIATTRPSIKAPAALGTWWQTFNDLTLEQLIADSVDGNLDLKEATQRVREARGQRGVVASGLYPSVNVGASGSKNRTSGNLSSTRGVPGFNAESSVYQAGFDASWELDVFGGTRRGIEAADAQWIAAIEDRRDTLVTLTAEVARNYIVLRGAQERLVIAALNIKSQQETLDLTSDRFKAGLASDLDVARAEAQVAQTQSQLPPLENLRNQQIRRLSVLLGKQPGALAEMLSPLHSIPRTPSQVPAGIPSELLRRRPDIRLAEAQLHAATAQIGVATSDLFPKFSITGNAGYASKDLKNLFESRSLTYGIGPGVTMPLFTAGRIQANIEVQNARQQQALIQYQKVVLNGFEEVEDALGSFQREQDRRALLSRAVMANRRSVELARELYSRGVGDFLSVLTAEQALYSYEDQLVQSDTAVATNLVALYKALGGGWVGRTAATDGPTTQPATAAK